MPIVTPRFEREAVFWYSVMKRLEINHFSNYQDLDASYLWSAYWCMLCNSWEMEDKSACMVLLSHIKTSHWAVWRYPGKFWNCLTKLSTHTRHCCKSLILVRKPAVCFWSWNGICYQTIEIPRSRVGELYVDVQEMVLQFLRDTLEESWRKKLRASLSYRFDT